jgi:hypothetical protein
MGHRRAYLVAALLIAVLLVAGCAAARPQDPIVGTWTSTTNPRSPEFKAGFRSWKVLVDARGSLHVWAYDAAGHVGRSLELQWKRGATPGTYLVGGGLLTSVTVSGDTMHIGSGVYHRQRPWFGLF